MKRNKYLEYQKEIEQNENNKFIKNFFVNKKEVITTNKYSWTKNASYYYKIDVKQIAKMGILLALYIVIKYIFSIIFKGPLNFNVELLFWIFNGILFGPIKGSIFSLLCDTIFTLFTTGIGYWMVEYAIVAPITSIIAWLIWFNYKEQNKATIFISSSTIFIFIIFSLILFFFQLHSDQFRYEGISSKNIIPEMIYGLISFLCISITSFLSFCLIMYKKNSDWKYIKWLHIASIIIVVVILLRWTWGPYAYYAYRKRFSIGSNIVFSKTYWLTLFGISVKSFITIPLAIIISIPIISTIDKMNWNKKIENNF